MRKGIPKPTIQRLAALFTVLKTLENQEQENTSSSELGGLLGVPSHRVRKDLSLISGIQSYSGGYNISSLREYLGEILNLKALQKACIVGLGPLGEAITNYPALLGEEYELAAGFDTNINRLEILTTSIPLFPAYDIPEILPEKKITLGILAVPPKDVEKSVQRLLEGGAKGILNLSPVFLPEKIGDTSIQNIFLAGELNVLSGLIKHT